MKWKISVRRNIASATDQLMLIIFGEIHNVRKGAGAVLDINGRRDPRIGSVQPKKPNQSNDVLKRASDECETR